MERRPLKNKREEHIVPIIMCTRGLWGAIGGGGALPQRLRTNPSTSRLAAWSARDVPTAAGRVVVALEESTYLTIVCPLLRLPDFVAAFATSVGAALEDLGIPIATRYGYGATACSAWQTPFESASQDADSTTPAFVDFLKSRASSLIRATPREDTDDIEKRQS
jgi:hypothetical protein